MRTRADTDSIQGRHSPIVSSIPLNIATFARLEYATSPTKMGTNAVTANRPKTLLVFRSHGKSSNL